MPYKPFKSPKTALIILLVSILLMMVAVALWQYRQHFKAPAGAAYTLPTAPTATTAPALASQYPISAKRTANAAQNPPTDSLEKLYRQLASIRDQKISHLTEVEILMWWRKLDNEVQQQKLHPAYALQLKFWLASLGEHPQLQSQLQKQQQALAQNIKQQIMDLEQQNQTNPKHQQYQQQEREIVQKLRREYADNPDQLNAELQRQLDAARADIYR